MGAGVSSALPAPGLQQSDGVPVLGTVVTVGGPDARPWGRRPLLWHLAGAPPRVRWPFWKVRPLAIHFSVPTGWRGAWTTRHQSCHPCAAAGWRRQRPPWALSSVSVLRTGQALSDRSRGEIPEELFWEPRAFCLSMASDGRTAVRGGSRLGRRSAGRSVGRCRR